MGGIRALIRARIEDGSFGASYPESCPDGAGPVGTDEAAFWQAMHAENPNLQERPWYGTLKSLRRHSMFSTWSSFRGGASENRCAGAITVFSSTIT